MLYKQCAEMKKEDCSRGCCHGNMDAIYIHVQRLEREKPKMDPLLICGDLENIATAK
ncbi:hypothetical protein EDB85DRAFT_635816 [Lactarius pseudohatsudake]|nr:hypothetical protein EDB85DRAFT_635816 [Lactarius pseudohatsudake]